MLTYVNGDCALFRFDCIMSSAIVNAIRVFSHIRQGCDLKREVTLKDTGKLIVKNNYAT